MVKAIQTEVYECEKCGCRFMKKETAKQCEDAHFKKEVLE